MGPSQRPRRPRTAGSERDAAGGRAMRSHLGTHGRATSCARACGLALCLTLGLGSAARSAHAEGAPTVRNVTPEDRETARSLMDDGDAKVAAGDLRGALDAYQAADRIMGVPTTGIEVAQTQAKLGELVEARDMALRVMRYPQLADEPGAFAAARTAARDLAASLAGRIPTLQVDVKGPGATVPIEVSLDGTTWPAGTHRHPRKVNPGTRVVRATAPGFEPTEQRLVLAEREQRVVSIELRPEAPPPPPPPPKPAPPPPTISPLVWIGAGLTVAGLGVGAVTGGLSLSKASDAKELCHEDACPGTAQEDIDDSLLLANVSNVAFAVGGVGLVLGVVGIVLSGSEEPEDAGTPPTGQAAAPRLVLGPGSLWLQGRF